ncbi:4-hydroxy-tetrahydrodipicolinate reductase [uncultured Cetobacterium sp.]|uniref:4-hydroxy-tetrahydrodipicolinate reductase n=1 Tax=uncultured Cetobacterium sp. TaxID=527638 RepID=UPI00262EC1FD|nr:4-hydroxy-tetrahydrodipicolinate reductase [uncultured Cetobacterium sp.]
MKIAIHGTGTMGKIIRDVGDDKIVAFVDDIEEIDINEKIDVIIDFSHFSKLNDLLDRCAERNYPLVIATTGYSGETLEKIVETSKKIPILLSSNTSLGINAINSILEKLVPRLEENFDIEIIEKHHNKKIDSPSGTAITLLKTIQNSLHEKYDVVYGREGMAKREKKEIGVHAVRGGTIVGEHTIIFAGEDEIIEISHKALSKKIFAVGALKCADFIIGKQPRLYTMKDIFK